MKAIVTVTRSDMPHNRGELFYRVNVIAPDGTISGLLNDDDYPWAWGFSDVKHALRVADHYGADYLSEDDESCTELARRLAEEERK